MKSQIQLETNNDPPIMSKSSLSSSSLKITNLPLRPESTAILLRRGFVKASEIESSKSKGGVSNLAAELGCSLPEAASISHEVERAILCSKRSMLSNLRLLEPEIPFTPPTLIPNFPDSEEEEHRPPSPPEDSRVLLHNGFGISASQLLQEQKSRSTRPIVTFSKSMDKLLGGGLSIGELTEIVGMPGVGKTQLAMQLCVDASLPKSYGGVGGEAVYIDSEGSFSPERCHSMAESLVQHVYESAQRRASRYQNSLSETVLHPDEMQAASLDQRPAHYPEGFTVESILNGIHVFRVHDEASQTATIRSLYGFLTMRKNLNNPVRIIVIDSIAFHYRSTTKPNYMERTRSLIGIAAILSDLATEFELATVVINHMTTKVDRSLDPSSYHPNTIPQDNLDRNSISKMECTTEDGTILIPALGESWAHAISTRIILSHDYTYPMSSPYARRKFILAKCPHKPCGVTFYSILDVGIRDCLAPSLSSSVSAEFHSQSQSQSQSSPLRPQNLDFNRDQGNAPVGTALFPPTFNSNHEKE